MSRKVINKEENENGSDGFHNASRIPTEIKKLLADLAEIRMTVLVGSPALLPKVAPALADAETIVQGMW